MVFLLLAACALRDALEVDTVPVPCAARESWYRDADGDGHGDQSALAISCAAPDGYVSRSDDCDDTDATVITGCDTGDTSTGSDDSGA